MMYYQRVYLPLSDNDHKYALVQPQMINNWKLEVPIR